MYESPGRNREFPRVQILTIEELLSGTKPDVPPMRATFERAERIRAKSTHDQRGQLLGVEIIDEQDFLAFVGEHARGGFTIPDIRAVRRSLNRSLASMSRIT